MHEKQAYKKYFSVRRYIISARIYFSFGAFAHERKNRLASFPFWCCSCQNCIINDTDRTKISYYFFPHENSLYLLQSTLTGQLGANEYRMENRILMKSRIELPTVLLSVIQISFLCHSFCVTPIHCFIIIFLALLSQKAAKSAYT